ncbi:MAG: hypothetical protein K940chlam3_00799, partial [Chlamydiae bacterium]|nr:hypothetical protein [Chlamydiota bacterium]
FEDQDFLRKLAFEIVKQSLGVKPLAKRINTFGFKNQKFRQKLALEMAKSESGIKALLKYIDRFEFDGQKFLQRLAFEMVKGVVSITRLTYSPFDKNYFLNIRYGRFDSDLKIFKDIFRILDLDSQSIFRMFIISLLDWNALAENAKGIFDDVRGSILNLLDDDQTELVNHLQIMEKYFLVLEPSRPTLKKFVRSYNSIFEKLKSVFSRSLRKRMLNLKKEVEKYDSLLSVMDDIALIKNDELKISLTFWMVSTISLLFSGLSKEKQAWMHETKIFRILYRLRDMRLRVDVRNLLFFQFQKLEYRTEFLNLVKPPHALPAKLVLNRLKRKRSEVDHDHLFETSLIKKRRKFLRDSWKHLTLLNCLNQLDLAEYATPEIVGQILKYFASLSDKELLQEINSLSALISLKKEGMIVIDFSSESKKQIMGYLNKTFRELIPGLMFNNFDKFQEMFFGERHPEAICAYIAGFQHLSDDDREKMNEIMRVFIHDIDCDQFEENRYRGSEHLDKVFDSRVGLKEKWIESRSESLETYLPLESTETKFNFVDYLKVKIDDGHLPMEALPELQKILSLPTKDLGSFSNQALDEILVGLVNHPDTFSRNILNQIEVELMRSHPKSEFLNDIQELKQIFDSAGYKEIHDWTIVNSDHPLDLFLCGTEVVGSCQRVTGSSNYNKALMGYVMDGKHRIIAIRDHHGKIIGRSILRLLYDEKNQGPVLFFERIYPGTLKYEYSDAMKAFALDCAMDLGLVLISKNPTYGTRYDGIVKSYNGKAPYEYCDAAGGLRSEEYEIVGSYFL